MICKIIYLPHTTKAKNQQFSKSQQSHRRFPACSFVILGIPQFLPLKFNSSFVDALMMLPAPSFIRACHSCQSRFPSSESMYFFKIGSNILARDSISYSGIPKSFRGIFFFLGTIEYPFLLLVFQLSKSVLDGLVDMFHPCIK